MRNAIYAIDHQFDKNEQYEWRTIDWSSRHWIALPLQHVDTSKHIHPLLLFGNNYMCAKYDPFFVRICLWSQMSNLCSQFVTIPNVEWVIVLEFINLYQICIESCNIFYTYCFGPIHFQPLNHSQSQLKVFYFKPLPLVLPKNTMCEWCHSFLCYFYNLKPQLLR